MQPSRMSEELASSWRFQIDQDDQGETEKWFLPDYNRSEWATKEVPGAWDFYDKALWSYEGIGWYATELKAEQVRPDLWQKLHFASVSIYAKVWLNGMFLGEHIGRYLPFEIDITERLATGEAGVLVIRVDNRPRPEWLPGTEVIEWVQYGGILQPVLLVSTPRMAVTDLSITAMPDGPGARVRCDVEVTNRSESAWSGEVSIAIDADEQVANARAAVQCAAGDRHVVSVVVECPRIRVWSLDSPVLYEATAELRSGEQIIDMVVERFGVRTVEVRGAEILLNGSPLEIKGYNRYDEYGDFGPTVPEHLIREDLLRIKRTGANVIRVHYPQAPDHHRIMDEIGLLLIEEVPVNWWKALPEADYNTAVVDAAEQALEQMIRRDRNHPCVIAWSMANESGTDTPVGIAAMRRLLRRARSLDPTRLVTYVAHSNIEANEAFDEADIVAVNFYYGLFGGELAHRVDMLDDFARKPTEARLRQVVERFPDKPIVMTEFGTHAIAGLHGSTRFAESYQASYIRAVWEAIRATPHVVGGVLWCWADYYHRRDFFGKGGAMLAAPYGPYGVVTVDRRPKLSLTEITRLYGGTVDDL